MTGGAFPEGDSDPNDTTLATYQASAQRYIERTIPPPPPVLASLDGLRR